jgi:hypothetical protein
MVSNQGSRNDYGGLLKNGGTPSLRNRSPYSGERSKQYITSQAKIFDLVSSQDSFKLKPYRVAGLQNDLDVIPSSQYRTEPHFGRNDPSLSPQSKCGYLHSDVSNLKCRLIKAKEELHFASVEKSDLLQKLHGQERATYKLKQDVPYGEVNLDLKNNENEAPNHHRAGSSTFRLNFTNADLQFRQKQNSKLQKSVDEYQLGNSQLQY